MNNDYPKRKHPRLKNYDYGSSGYYYVTVNTYNNQSILSKIRRDIATDEVEITLSSIGRIVEEQLLDLEKRYSGLIIDKYVIMPNHIHVIFILDNPTAGASPRPTQRVLLIIGFRATTRGRPYLYNI